MSQCLSIDDLLRIRYPTTSVPPRLSPDGRSLALSLSPAVKSQPGGSSPDYDVHNVPRMAVDSQISVIDVPTGERWQAFPEAEVSWGAQWSPDGSMLAAYVVMGGPACLGIVHLADRRLQLVRDAAVRPFFGFELPVWTPDSRAVVAKLWTPVEAAPADAVTSDSSTPDLVVFSHDPGVPVEDRSEGRFVTDRLRCNFGVVDIKTNNVRILAENWTIIGGWRMSPDGTAVAVPVIVEADATRRQFISDLMVVPLDGAEPRAVARRVVFEYGQTFSWSPDGAGIAFTTSDQPNATGERPKGRLLVADAEGQRQPLDLSADIEDDLRHECEHPRWSTTGEEIFCLVADGVWSVRTDGSGAHKVDVGDGKVLLSWIQPPGDQVMRTARDGTLPLLLRDPTSHALELAAIGLGGGRTTTRVVLRKRYDPWGAPIGMEIDWRKQTTYLQLEASDHPPEVWRLDVTTGEARRLASLTPGLEDHQFGSKHLVEYLDADGRTCQASLLLPPDYVEGQQVSMLVIVYAGSMGSQRIFKFGLRDCLGPSDAYLYASHGYAVLLPDIPLGPRDTRRVIPRSVLPAVNRVVELGIADPARIGVLGHSFGGYSVLALITQTEIFKAAVCSAGAVNLTSFYGALSEEGDAKWLGWCESGQPRLGGSLWENRDAYIENSALFYLDRVTTPLLLFSGNDDPGAFAQASEAFNALRRLGQRVELRNYRGEGHAPAGWSEANLRDVLDRAIAWFDEHLTSE